MTSKLLKFDELLQIAKEKYRQTYLSNPEVACCAPGRVNLIGEHVDYNDGYVLPMALPMVTIILGGKNGTGNTADITTCSETADEPKRIQFETNSPKPGVPKWANYVKGVVRYFGEPVPGFNAVIMTNVPVGGGLSSSAALEVSTLAFLQEITGKHVESQTERAMICQKAEHNFAHMPCGIMDQLISVAGKESHALLIDCKSLETFQIPFEVKDLAVLICNSNVRHELSGSEYGTRREQCLNALQLMGLESYRQATEDHLSALRRTAEEVLVKRARHVITEIKRTHEAAKALRTSDFVKVGELMTKSHVSLRDDFEVSCRELDALVESAINCPGVLGSRMTGGGFGGCTVTLVRADRVEQVVATMQQDFQDKCGGRADFYVCTPCDGARVCKLT